jgi:uncharacterized membrane protein YqhA
MFIAGSVETVEAFLVFMGEREFQLTSDTKLEATVILLAALDRFLFGMVLLVFAYNVFFLFIRPVAEDTSAESFRIPDWLRATSLGQMKKTMLEVIIVVLAVLFLKNVLANQQMAEMDYNLVLTAVGIIVVAVAIKLIDFNH